MTLSTNHARAAYTHLMHFLHFYCYHRILYYLRRRVALTFSSL